MKLRASLAWGFFIVSAVVLAIAGTFQIAYNYQNQREIVFAQQQLIAQDAASEVSNFIEDKFNVLETAVSLENVAAVSPEDQERILGNALGFQPAFRQLALFDADGLDEKEVAVIDPVPSNAGSVIELVPTGADLAPYIKADQFTLKVRTITDEALTRDHTIEVFSRFHVEGRLIGSD